MAKLIKLAFEGGEIWIEADENAVTEGGIRKVSLAESMSKVAETSLNHLVEPIRAFCVSLAGSVKNIPKELLPETIGIEFGVKVNGTGNFIIVKGTGEASITVKMEWKTK